MLSAQLIFQLVVVRLISLDLGHRESLILAPEALQHQGVADCPANSASLRFA